MVAAAVGLALAKGLAAKLGTEAAGRLVEKKLDTRALHHAVAEAVRRADARHGATFARYDITPSFFEHEGADELEKLMLPGSGPSARTLAAAAVASIGADPTGHLLDPLVVPFEDLLAFLAEELGRYRPFRMRLHEVAITRPTTERDADEREYLRWITDHFEYIETAGLGTLSHVQFDLFDVFTELRGVRERADGRRWSSRAEEQVALARERLASGQVDQETYEVIMDRIAASEREASPSVDIDLSVGPLINGTSQVVVLGDPGSGKTTLLRHLALSHASERLRSTAATLKQTDARLPIYVRAGDFARSGQREQGLRPYFASYLSGKLECPVDLDALRVVIDRALTAGRALILIDGLDEVATVDDRNDVVRRITALAATETKRGNRLVCTSRIAGYAASPLPFSFTAVRLQDMDDATIDAFLGRYVPAVMRVEAPGKADEILMSDAERTIEDLETAFERSPGVRRLAANPLLLIALLLVQRTRGALPERRVDAYKAVTEALGDTWRRQHVPHEELPDARQLTRWLARLAGWMHAHRPEGTAGLRDLVSQWGPLLASLQRVPFDPQILEAADIESTPTGHSIREFAEQVEAHSGLLVERAPQRWGFPHLTFEEYYAGRSLVFEGRAAERPLRVRKRLHDARYDEPILLALGLIGLEQPEEVEELFEVAILARGAEAAALGISPSRHEDLLGRDFRFALRVLADDVPVSPSVVDELLGQAVEQLAKRDGPARYEPYRLALMERLRALRSVSAGRVLVEAIKREPAQSLPVEMRAWSAESDIGASELYIRAIAPSPTKFDEMPDSSSEPPVSPLEPLSRRQTLTLLADALRPPGADATRAARVRLADELVLPREAIDKLVEALFSVERDVADWSASLLQDQPFLTVAAASRLAETASSADTVSLLRITEALSGAAGVSSLVIDRLTRVASEEDPFSALWAADLLLRLGKDAPTVETDLGPIDPPSLARWRVIVRHLVERDREADLARSRLLNAGWLPEPIINELVDAVLDARTPSLLEELMHILRSSCPLPDGARDRMVDITLTARGKLLTVGAAEVLKANDYWPPEIAREVHRIALARGTPNDLSLRATALLAPSADAELRARARSITLTSWDPDEVATAGLTLTKLTDRSCLDARTASRLQTVVLYHGRRRGALIAMQALGEAGCDREPAFLDRMFADRGTPRAVVAEALRALPQRGVSVQAAVDAAVKCLEEPTPTIRSAAVSALARLAAEPEYAAPITDALADLVRQQNDLEEAEWRYQVLWRVAQEASPSGAVGSPK